jgi:methylenetetrahydrofolate dehydrogenase (NADP+) / methenyltetrahydrofolate cyclohydrolase
MSALIIDGKKISEYYRQEYKLRVDQLRLDGVQPGLAVVIVGENPASQVYVRNKAKACESIGMHSEIHAMNEATTEAELLEKISALNEDSRIHGILVQLPVPAHINTQRVLEAIAPDKDVDGFHFVNVGALIVGTPVFPPCTPWGVMKMLEYSNINVEGMDAVVIGRSTIVGKPQALMLINAGATVTVCHSKTKNLIEHVKRADLIVAAIGRANFVTADMVKPGAVVIDVGINRLPDGKLCGDVDYTAVAAKASAITPVPGGVGPMTITMLLGNTLKSAEQKHPRHAHAGHSHFA